MGKELDCHENPSQVEAKTIHGQGTGGNLREQQEDWHGLLDIQVMYVYLDEWWNPESPIWGCLTKE